MISDELGMELHDRYMLDEPLTSQEQAQLEDWYAQKDSAEAVLLEQHQPRQPNLVVLQMSLDSISVQPNAVVASASGDY